MGQKHKSGNLSGHHIQPIQSAPNLLPVCPFGRGETHNQGGNVLKIWTLEKKGDFCVKNPNLGICQKTTSRRLRGYNPCACRVRSPLALPVSAFAHSAIPGDLGRGPGHQSLEHTYKYGQAQVYESVTVYCAGSCAVPVRASSFISG